MCGDVMFDVGVEACRLDATCLRQATAKCDELKTKPANPKGTGKNGQGRTTCYTCGGQGHYAYECKKEAGMKCFKWVAHTPVSWHMSLSRPRDIAGVERMAISRSIAGPRAKAKVRSASSAVKVDRLAFDAAPSPRRQVGVACLLPLLACYGPV